MVTYKIDVNIGDKNRTNRFYFKHTSLKEDESDKLFNDAVTELNHIYKNYGRFATAVGVTNLFKSFGFELTESYDFCTKL